MADRFMDLLGKVFQRREWRMWRIDVERIIIHPNYDGQGRCLDRYCKFGNFREFFFFAKLRICEVSLK